MKFWQVKRGNTTVQDIPVYDKDGVLVPDLINATEIKFQVCEQDEGSEVIQKDKSDGIEINIPETGYLRITLKPSDTKIPARKYFMSLQVKWGPDRIYETVIKVDGKVTERFEILPEFIKT